LICCINSGDDGIWYFLMTHYWLMLMQLKLLIALQLYFTDSWVCAK